MPKSHKQWFGNEPTRRPIGLVESMPQHQAHGPTMENIQSISPLVNLQGRGVAAVLARQQEEYEEYLVEKTVGETPCYLARLRAAQQAAKNAVSSTKDDLGPQYPFWFKMGIVVAVASSILLFIKLRLS